MTNTMLEIICPYLNFQIERKKQLKIQYKNLINVHPQT